MVASTSGSAVGVLILGIALLVGGAVLYRVEPRFQSFIEDSWFAGRQLPGRELRMRGGPFLLAGFGLVCVAVGVAGLV